MNGLAGATTLGEILPIQAARAELANKPALFFGDQIYTYRDLDRAIAGIARELRRRRIAAGAAVALLLPNCPALIAYLLAVLSRGAVAVPLNPAVKPADIGYMVGVAGARMLVTTREWVATLQTAGAPDGIDVVVVDPSAPLNASAGGRANGGAEQADAPAIGSGSTAFLIFTSGTTGRPKAVVLSHGNVLANTAQVGERTGLTADDRVLHVMPLFHANGLMNNTLLPLRAGASIVLCPRFELGEFWGIVQRLRPTYFTAVPTVFARLVDAWDGRAVTSSLRFVRSGAAPMPPVLQQEVESRLGVPVVLSYGLSEATCTCTMNPVGWTRRLASAGTALCGETLVVLDPAGHAQPAGVVGEVAVEGPNVMAGYLDAAAATREVLVDGRLRTGDMGYLDPDGFLFLTDRKKDLIIRGGENISPREVEEVLLAHEAVAEAAVVGQADREWGEEVAAFVVVRAGTSVTPESLALFCRERLARFKVPRTIRVIPALPLTSLGKIDKAGLRALCANVSPKAAR